ncbi:hypothetical protein [Spiroplasma endosymbiont of Polydrusus pterygomalis]|uniref:hypothetical protein n=1 Tax=Spiroplasma endosymbiont of Polydrusus pterygomalis TaxID=3139327 RepID=UPI003CCA952E
MAAINEYPNAKNKAITKFRSEKNVTKFLKLISNTKLFPVGWINEYSKIINNGTTINKIIIRRYGHKIGFKPLLNHLLCFVW